MEYLAHISEDGLRSESVRCHLLEVAKMASRFAAPFHAEKAAYRIGTCHDAGKYQAEFQRRIRGANNQVDHATAGAQILFGEKDRIGALAVAGHHGGLPDLGNPTDTDESPTLFGRNKKRMSDYSAFFSENTVDKINNVPPKGDGFSIAFYTRMLFSALVDADYLCTERFMQNGETGRTGYAALEELLLRFNAYANQHWSRADTPLNRERLKIREYCTRAAKTAPGLFNLTIPTGGGKTAASMAFALNHAIAHGKRRIIYVIPYTSIIEQNSDVFAAALGDENVLQHHSAADVSSEDERKRLAADNWDAPVIMTTAVQFLESLFASKPGKCRKLHNIADSVVIFDEAQMLPLNLLRPSIAAVSQLIRSYGVTAVMCTATQPSLGDLFREFLPEKTAVELCPPDLDQSVFRRVEYSYSADSDEDSILAEIASERQALCIVNTRARAESWYHSLQGEGNYHLSTRMTPNHRRKVLEVIRNRLEKGLPCRVISTSLIEAGVDVDFPVVYREIAGMDSIIQAAGRCNRNGKATGSVRIFRTGEHPPRLQEKNISAGESILNSGMMPDHPRAVESYFRKIYRTTGDDGMDRGCDGKPVLKALNEGDSGCRLPIRTVSGRYKIISEDTQTVIVPNAANAGDIAALRSGVRTRALMRRLAQDSVSLYSAQYSMLYKSGKIDEVDQGVAILLNPDESYSAETGIIVSAVGGDALFC